ncbi:BTB/POZ domain-containing protein At1g67900-like isoform X2 [Salvia splendens]|uniref:BTB/POZ domain-containing protein At1g67900-like isoform X2 n=1 Tax=Salvia splendens TaxID=180675 RepID=UPI001C27270E|nr:BTB/POZ domain-containing protein At1g67900-like isoform X2 [Salvia splendens]
MLDLDCFRRRKERSEMKFMKLGSRPDTFYTTEAVRSVSCEASSDVIVQVKGNRYLLHKRLYAEAASELQLIKLHDFPGGVEAFELCAKFCYGINITLSAFNVVSVRCGAEYLQMTEEAEKGNLISKVEVFLNSCILRGWRDSIVTLQTTKAFPSLSEEVGVTRRCIEAVASRVLSHPEEVVVTGRCIEVSSNGSGSHGHRAKGWWDEDLAELGIDLYWRVMVAIKSGGKVPSHLIGDALRAYSSRWLPNLGKCIHDDGEVHSRNRLILESVVSLLPAEKGAVSCSFLLKLLKAANVVNASVSSKKELAKRAGFQLDEATVDGLLLPSCCENGTRHDVDAVLVMLEEFVSRSAEGVGIEFQERRRSSSAAHSKVAKLVDEFLLEIARDANLPMSKFIAIAEAIPEFARVVHDGLYKAIDVYLKEHPELSKGERKSLCRILDCKKLSVEACTHAARNEMLPLRVVVQVLFFEKVRASMAGDHVTELPSNIKVLLEGRPTPSKRASGINSQNSSVSTLKMRLHEDHDVESDRIVKPSNIKSLSMMPSRSKRMFSKLWPISRSASEKN